MTSAPYTKVGKNQVIEIKSTVIIGKGASSRVFSGKFDHKDVAVKRVYIDEYTIRELDLIRLFEHENIVRYLYKDFDDNFMYIVMEKCDCNLQEFIDGESFQSKKVISRIEILNQTTNGLAYLHDIKDIIHRDIKPSNTLLLLQSQKWVVRIADFGISTQLPQNKSRLTQTSIKGTVGNTAPEALNNEKISKKSDIFSLGILFYFTLSGGEHPYGTDMLKLEAGIRDGEQPTMEHLDKKYADDAKFLISSMIAHKCEDRFDITQVQSHHLFWNNKKKIEFIQVIFDYAVAKTTSKVILTKLNENSEPIIGKSWRAPVYAVSPVIKEVLEEKRPKKQGDDIMSLLRNIRNLKNHFDEKPTEFKKLMANGGFVDDMEFFFKMFPALISHVYEVMRSEKPENPIFKRFFYAREEPRPESPARKISSTQVNAIIMFNELDKHLYSFNLPTKEWYRMQVLPECDSKHCFTTVVSGKHIYFIQNQKVYQLEYYDSAAEWKEMSSTIEQHGEDPPSAVLNGLIYVCGRGGHSAGDPSRSVERYDAALDRWDCMCDMNTARYRSCVVATEDHIYCIGGEDIESVERFDERLIKWEFVKSAPRPIGLATAAVVENRIYVTGHVDKRGYDDDGLLCYDIQNDSWSEIDLMIQWPFSKQYYMKILAVDEELYVMGFIRKWKWKSAIYLLEPETKQMTLVEEFDDNNINPNACLAVKL